MGHKELLEAFFKSYDESGVAKVDGLLSKHAGNEKAVMEKLDEKYQCAFFNSAFDMMAVFKANDPSKVDSIPALLGKNKGREKDVAAKVRMRFGTTGGTAGASDYATRVRNLFQKYDPSKAANTDAFLQKYAGNEEAFIAKLVEKYGPEPGGASAPATPSGGGTGGASSYAARVRGIFEKYDPPKAANTDAFLQKYAGNEEAFIAKLVEKYGPEPSASTPAAGASPRSHAARVRSIFEKYDPSKAANTDAFLQKYAGNEEAFIAKLVEKYGPEPEAAAPAAGGGPSDYVTRVRSLFQKYDPSKAAHTDTFLQKYAGNEEALIAKLVEKYGPEPASGASAATTPRDHASRIRSIFEKYDPSKAANTDAFLQKYAGNEEAFIAKLVEKYGPEPEAPAAGGAAPRDYATRIRSIFEKYDPSKAANTSAFLQKYAGNEEAFIAKLVEKYGPEPVASAAPAGGSGQASTLPPKPPSDWAARIEAIFKKSEPAKCGSAEALCAKYAGQEASVFKKIIGKYGPEPYWAERLTRLFKAHGKEALLAKIPDYLTEHAGNEEELVTKLVGKLGPEPTEAVPAGGAAAAETAAAGSTDNMTMKAKVVRFLFYVDSSTVVGWIEKLEPGGKYHGKESDLYAALLNRHKSDPSPADPPQKSDTKARVVNMYALYAPEKIAGVEPILDRYKGREEELIATLVKKYGDEPCTGGSDGKAKTNRTYKERIEAIYQKYCPEKVGNVPGILEKYKGKESDIIQKLVSMYGPEPSGESPEEFLARVTRFYKKYNAEKVDTVPDIVAKYKGREEQLMEGLVKKYGPEPEEEEEEEEEEGTEREQQERRETKEWAKLDADSRMVHVGERAARWDVEDQDEAEWEELVETEQRKRDIVKKRSEANGLLRREYYDLLLKKLKDKIREEKRRHRALLDERMSVYDQLQTNKDSMKYYERLARRNMEEKEKRQKKFDAPPKTPPTRSASVSSKDFVSYNVRMASASPSRRSVSGERETRRARSKERHEITPAALERVLIYQKKWLPKEYRLPDYPTLDEVRGNRKGFSSRKTLESRHRDKVSQAVRRVEEEAHTLQTMTGQSETALERAMTQLSSHQVLRTQDMWNSLVGGPTSAHRSSSYDPSINRSRSVSYY